MKVMYALARRRVLIVGAAVVGTAAILVLAAGLGGVVRGEPQGAAAAREALRNLTGTTCFEETFIDGVLPITEADNLAEQNRFLDWPKTAFVGDLDPLVAAVGGQLTSRATDEAWIMLTGADGPLLVHYSGVTTPKGRTLWHVVGWERACGSS